jgi:protease-4
MKQFFKYMFASMFGFIIAGVLLIFILAALIGSALNSSDSEKEVVVKEKSILQISLDDVVKDKASQNPFEGLSKGKFDSEKKLNLYHIIRSIKAASTDNNIAGIFLDLQSVNAGAASTVEIRNALLDFKKTKKFIYAYSEMYSQKSYFLASVADKVFLNPQGDFDWKGLSAELLFFKHTLEKLEIEPQIIRHGKFKSAVEPFIEDKMSTANRLQTKTYMNDIWNTIVNGVSLERKISVSELQNYANTLAVQSPDDALKLKFVDKLTYRDEVITELKKLVGKDAKAELSFLKLEKYDATVHTTVSSNKIAVIYAEGEIESGDGDANSIGSETLAKEIHKAANDENVKAIVLRVNSPGGSALASDVIWRETKLAASRKTFVVSMGDLAASGGYYIACGANKIFAEPTTITGSIGVFGLMFNVQKLLNNKLGIYVDTVKTNALADIGSSTRSMTMQERQIIQNGVERVYATFIGRVAEGRKKSTADIDSIGQGRVWSGSDAKDLGLVDELGGLNDAINYAAKKANIDKYRILELPKSKNLVEQIFNNVDDETETRILKTHLGNTYPYYMKFNHVLNMRGIQARMEYDVDIY